jgi:serine/threonine protein kinase
MSTPPTKTDSTPEIAGRMAGEYRLGRKLGEGGFGAVYEAEHPVLRRRAAVKVLHQAAGMDSDAVLRFISEAQAASQIRSRHIVDIFSFGKLASGRHFYVMDLLDGLPLDRFLRHIVRCDVVTTLQLLRPIADALDAAHAAGVVHRDLKPQNMFLAWEASGETVPKLLDFGMAKLLGESSVHTVSGVPIGTPLYMSPEQARGERVDGRSDVYALGVVCHEMLCGQVPFTGESPLAVLMAHLTLAPPRLSQACPDLPVELDAPILHMLNKEADGRPLTAGAAIAELIRAAESAGLSVPAGMPHIPRPPITTGVYADLRVDTDGASASDAAFGSPDTLDSNDPEGLLGRTDPAPVRRELNWSFVALLGVLAAGALYFGTTALRASAQAPGVSDRTTAKPASSAAALPATAPALTPAGLTSPLAAAPPAPAPAGAVPTAPPPNVPARAAETHPSVQLTLHGAPPGARITLNGALLGEAPGPIAVPFGKSAVELSVTAPGYEPQKLTVTPAEDQSTEIKLKKRVSHPKTPGGIPSDLESPF